VCKQTANPDWDGHFEFPQPAEHGLLKAALEPVGLLDELEIGWMLPVIGCDEEEEELGYSRWKRYFVARGRELRDGPSAGLGTRAPSGDL